MLPSWEVGFRGLNPKPYPFAVREFELASRNPLLGLSCHTGVSHWPSARPSFQEAQ